MGKWYCEASHPDIEGLFCRLDPQFSHEFHVAFQGDEDIRWPNADYSPPPPPAPSDKKMRGKLLDMVREIDRPSAYLRHNPRSTEVAAADLSAVGNSKRRKDVLLVIWQAGAQGVTDDEVSIVLDDPDVPAPRVASRRKELVEGGWVEVRVEDGREVERKTRTGAPAKVWVLTEAGRAAIQQVDFS